MVTIRQNLTAEELVEHFTLTPHDLVLLSNKSGASRLGFALLLKLFERDLRFPESLTEVPETAVAFVAKQVGVLLTVWPQLDWKSNQERYAAGYWRRHSP